MKNYIILSVLAPVFVWGCMAFLKAKLNPFMWSEATRGFALFLFGMLLVMIWSHKIIIANNEE